MQLKLLSKVKIFTSRLIDTWLNSKIKGINISNPPAGDGTPSKKLFFHSC